MWVLVLPIVVCVLFALSVFELLRRRWRRALLWLAAGAALNVWTESIALHPFTSGRVAAEPRDTACLRVLTYNVFGNSPYLTASRHRPEGAAEMVAFIDSMHADIVALPEYNKTFSRPLGDTLEARFPYNTLALMPTRDYGEINLYSRYPIRNLRRFHLPIDTVQLGHMTEPLRTKVWWMDIDVHGRTVKVVFCHLLSNMYSNARRRTVQDSLSWWAGRRDYYEGLTIGYDLRAQQARAIRDSLATWHGPVIVLGDLNDIGGSAAIRAVEAAGLRDAWWSAGLGFGFTYDAYHLLLRLDHILVSPHFGVRGVKVLDEVAFSDHLPLVADLEWAGQ